MTLLDDVAAGDGMLDRDAERIVEELLASGADPSGVILDELTSVKDQGPTSGTCASCALTTVVEHAFMSDAINQAFGTNKAPMNLVLDETFVDYLLRRDRGDMSGGAMLGEVAHAISRYGICRKGMYDGGEPSEVAFEDAATRIVAVVPFLAPGEPAVPQVIEHLRARRKIAVGLPIDSSFKGYRPSGAWTMYQRWHEEKVFDAPEHIVSDHAVAIVGQRERDGAFLAQSSWGPYWGMGGYAWISRKYLTMWGVAGFCYVVLPGQ